MSGKLIAAVVVLASLGGLGWTGFQAYSKGTAPAAPKIPMTTVKMGDVSFEIAAQGELRGGNSELLVAPPIGGREMVMTYLRKSGEMVEAGEDVARFDTTEQEFNLREAEADLGEAEQQILQAKADTDAKEEESRYALIHARGMVKLAELDVRKNNLVSRIEAQQNTLALEAARDQLRKLEEDSANQKATNLAAMAIQEAVRSKAKVKADMAKRNIDSMTLKARTGGYVSVGSNTASSDIMYTGMQLPLLQLGDTVRAGMAIATIPDLNSWEITARISELDRGHLAEGNKVVVTIVALPGKTFRGKVKGIGGTGGPVWNRTFECRVSVDDPVAEMRPGMSGNIVITTGEKKKVLWIPSQALFESDGKTFVYLLSGTGFQRADVQMLERGESKVVISGLKEGQHVALANPTKETKKQGPGGVMQAVPKG